MRGYLPTDRCDTRQVARLAEALGESRRIWRRTDAAKYSWFMTLAARITSQ